MLHTEAIEASTLNVIKDLMTDEKLTDFFLVDGTNLVLNYGHRKSVDINLFTQKEFNNRDLEKYLKERYNFSTDFMAINILKGYINGTMIDCITYQYPLLQPLKIIDKIRMASIEDIAAMKLATIVDNGSRIKDFVDITEIAKHICLNTMINAYEKKYDYENRMIVLKTLSYYDDIKINEPIQCIDKKYTNKNILRLLTR